MGDAVGKQPKSPGDRPTEKFCVCVCVQGGPKKCGHELVATVQSDLNRFSIFYWKTARQIGSKAVIKIPPHFAYVATLPCETLTLKNKRLPIIDKVVFNCLDN